MAKKKAVRKTKKKPARKSKKKAAPPRKAARSKKAAAKKKPATRKAPGTGVAIEITEVEVMEPEDIARDEEFPPDYGGSE